jgi:hypothetical protein
MNPAISVIGDLRGLYADDRRRKLEFQFEEAEFSFISSIDPYAKADFYVSYSRNDEGEYAGTLEEAYVTSLSLPLDLRVRAGRFRLPVGRLNPVHPHALPFSDQPAPVTAFFGDEGLIDEGVAVSWLVPNPFEFYQEFEVSVTGTPEGSPLFSRPEAARYSLLAHLKNFWETDENTTLEFGLSGMTGPNGDDRTTLLGAADLTVKWKPLQFNAYKSLTWQTEAFLGRYGYAGGGYERPWGMYSFVTWQAGRRWFVTGRYDYTNLPTSSRAVRRAASATLGWYATEFQKIEFGGRLPTSNDAPGRTEFVLRWVFVIGAHGAHQY